MRFLLLATMALTAFAGLHAQIHPVINYQGYVEIDGVPVSDATPGNYQVEFYIYDRESEGTILWAEAQSITIFRGTFSALLGAGTPIGEDEAGNALPPRPALTEVLLSSRLWVTFRLPDIADAEIAPRQQIASVPRALVAGRLPDASITPAMLAPGAINDLALAADSVTHTALADGAVTADKLKPQSISGDLIQDASLTAADLAPGAFAGIEVTEGLLSGSNIANGTLTGSHFVQRSLTTDHLANGTLNETHFSGLFEPITSARIQDGTITPDNLRDGALGFRQTFTVGESGTLDTGLSSADWFVCVMDYTTAQSRVTDGGQMTIEFRAVVGANGNWHLRAGGQHPSHRVFYVTIWAFARHLVIDER